MNKTIKRHQLTNDLYLCKETFCRTNLKSEMRKESYNFSFIKQFVKTKTFGFLYYNNQNWTRVCILKFKKEKGKEILNCS